MDFRFTEDQQDLIDAAKAVFDGENTVERMRTIAAGEEVTDLWPQFAELGLLGLMAQEKSGGLEQPLVVMASIAECAGYAGLVEPLIETAGVVVPILETFGETDSLAKVLAGEQCIGVITPLKPYLNQADKCNVFIQTDKDSCHFLPNTSIEMSSRQSVDPLRNLSVARLDSEYDEMTDYRGAVLNAAQLVGLSARMVDMSVEYAKDRHQFGKPIGSFQAIKHHLATVYTQIEFTRPMVHLAALQGSRAVHTAKIAAVDTAMLAAETAIQVHGGMGYTYEVDLHMFMKRAWALCGEWGDRNYHMKKLEDLVLNGDAKIGAGTTFN